MYVSRVSVQDIKSFHGPRQVDLTLTRPDGTHAGWTVLAGRNGSGKTTLLQAIALALSGSTAARSLMPGFANWVTQGAAEGSVEVVITFEKPYDVFTDINPQDSPLPVGLKWIVPREHVSNSGIRFTRGALPSMEETGAEGTRNYKARRGPWEDNPMGWFCASYGPFRQLAGSTEVELLSYAPGPVARHVHLFHENAALADGLSWLVGVHLRALEGRPGAEQLKEAALAILRDGLLPDGYRIEGVDSEGLWVEREGKRFPLREMSDGFRAVAALVVDILQQIDRAYGHLRNFSPERDPLFSQAPGVVLIDEIDAHLHVSWQRRIGPWMTSHFPNIQFIVTTHSPYVCQSADPGGLILLPGANENAAPEVVPEDLYERVVYGSGDDAVLSDLFGLDTPYSERAEYLRAEFVALEAKVYDGDTSPETVSRYKELKGLLTSSPTARVHEMSAQLQRIAGEIEDGEGGEAE
ncbi:AAA family ATPase [Streptomyces sp. NPDC001832]|uniref:AAA family ATPase n=1 Tax=Streptomyces sp. NPDC001832 TaxID=3154527 RepID=UPI0033222871